MPKEPMTRKDLEKMLIAKSQADPSFRKTLLSNPKDAISKALNGGLQDGLKIKVVEESPDTFFLVLPPAAQGELADADLEKVAGGLVSGPAARTTGAPIKSTDSVFYYY